MRTSRTTSVVVPAYNARAFLGQTLESVRAQSIPDWELIVVDDGSTDETSAIAADFARRDSRIRAVRQPNGGVATARNTGIATANPEGGYIAFLDHDDVWEPDTLEVLRATLDATPRSVAAYGLPREIDAQGRPHTGAVENAFGYRRRAVVGDRVRDWPADAPATLGVFATWDCISTPGQVLIRRRALDAAGSFDPGVAPSDDWDMWIRLSLSGPFAFLLRFVIDKRAHEHNLSTRGLIGAEEKLRRKLYLDPHLTPAQRRTLSVGYRYGARLRLEWALVQVRRGDLRSALRETYGALQVYAHYLRLYRALR